jgi:hypothetical protein
MQIDHEYLKRLLEAFAAASGPLTNIEELEGRGMPYRDPQFVFHMGILEDKALIARDDHKPGFGLTRSVDGFESWGVLPLRLTANGHEFLEALRDQRILAVIKRQFKTAGIGTLVTVSKTLLESYTKEAIGALMKHSQ